MMITKIKRITRSYVKENLDKIFLFGDNLQQTGFGGQAKEMRGELNAVGIPTKKKPTMEEDAFFTDDEFWDNVRNIDNAFCQIWKVKPDFDIKKDILVVPSNGLGTGLAKLPEKAPDTWDYINQRLREFESGQFGCCPDCDAIPGNYHECGCDVERCPNCGGQLISCSCEEPKNTERIKWMGYWHFIPFCDREGITLNDLYMNYNWNKKEQKWIKNE